MTDSTAGGVIAFAPLHNTPGKADAAEFQARARAFVKLHGGKVCLFDDSKRPHDRASDILHWINEYDARTSKLVCVAFFCHGWSRGIEAGFDLRVGRGMLPSILATALATKGGAGLIVPLYCCSTADEPGGAGKTIDTNEAPGGDGGFADALRDGLCKVGVTNCRIDAHDTDGHTTRNPRVRRFEGSGSLLGGYGGRWIVAPNDPLFPKWRHALRETDLDLRYPFLDVGAVLRELSA